MFHVLRVWGCRVCGLGTLPGILIRCGVCMRSTIALCDVMSGEEEKLAKTLKS